MIIKHIMIAWILGTFYKSTKQINLSLIGEWLK